MIHPQQPECKQVPVVIVSALCGTYAFVWFNTSRRLQKGFKVLTDVHILKYFGSRCMYSDSKKNCPDIFQCEILESLVDPKGIMIQRVSSGLSANVGFFTVQTFNHPSELAGTLGDPNGEQGIFYMDFVSTTIS